MPKRPNILMIVVDCLRSDRIFSSERTCKTPNIDRLVERGTALPNVFVENSITAPSFSTIFTGRYASNHGVVAMVGVKLADHVPTLAQILRENGYETYAEVTGPLSPVLGVDRGFSHYRFRNQREYYFTDWGKDLLQRLETGAFGSPFFLLVHFWEAHVPRAVEPAFDSEAFGATPYDRSISGLDAYIGRLVEAAGPDTAVILTGDHGECVGEIPQEETLLPYFLQKLGLPPVGAAAAESIDSVVDLMTEEKSRLHQFASEIREITETGEGKIGWGRRLLMARDLLLIGLSRYRIQAKKGLRTGFLANWRQKIDDLLLFFSVARGRPDAAQLQLVRNSLNEHKLQHGYHVYDYLQRVPAVFVGDERFPAGRRIESEVRHIDLLPTLIEAFELNVAEDGFDGTSYYDHFAGGDGPDRPVYLEARSGAQAEQVFLIRGIRREGKKLAYAPFEPDGPVELYDLATDPEERVNLATSQQETVQLLREEAEAIAASFSAAPSSALSATENIEMVKRLKDLGYM